MRLDRDLAAAKRKIEQEHFILKASLKMMEVDPTAADNMSLLSNRHPYEPQKKLPLHAIQYI